MALAQSLTTRPLANGRTFGVKTRSSHVPKASLHTTPERLSRRTAVGVLVALPSLLGASAALAKNPETVKNAKEERKAALREAVKEIKETGEDRSAFGESSYAVSEDKSPNVHTRQEEGMRKSS